MDDRPDVIEQQIERTRERLDAHLDQLDTRVGIARERLKAQAQWWGGVSAVAAGAIGAAVFWPKGRH
ncbi:MAG: DUF3618 domain-containing protein [Acidobacteria bacterium]|nr:DUF3618 domain-containing protein [Acidobacteriota bacterium]